MLRDILNTHKEMMFNFMEVCDMDEYGLAWFCFLKGCPKIRTCPEAGLIKPKIDLRSVVFPALIVWIF